MIRTLARTSFGAARKAPLAVAALACALTAFASQPASARSANRGMESAHQPVVQRTDFVFDAAADSSGRLSAMERTRLLDWFEAIRVGFGDRVSIADNGSYDYPSLRDSIGGEVARFGLLVADQAPETAGKASPGSVRIVVSRSTARVPSCPDWDDRGEPNRHGGLSYNYGCSIAQTMAAMVADPQDLVEGRTSATALRGATSSRAIKAYSEQAPTGSGGLKSESTGGR